MTRREQLLLVGVAAAVLVGAAALYVHGKQTPQKTPPIQIEQAVSTEAEGALVSPAPPARGLTPPPVQDVAALFEEKPKAIAVSVAGAVRSPGTYELELGARVQDIVDKARGLNEEADTRDINLAAPLIDGTTLTIPHTAKSIRDDGTLVARGARRAAEVNPPQYTISGWVSGAARGPSAPATIASPPPSGSSPGGLIDINTAPTSELENLPGIGPKLAGDIAAYRAQTPFTSIEELDNVPGIGPKRLEAIRGLVTVR
ncbi:MAG: hypothetical protein GWP08_07900 [Nitrospiraceae bacterium]|nr:hypothetical protein [Nitrospiraceae bacterium]